MGDQATTVSDVRVERLTVGLCSDVILGEACAVEKEMGLGEAIAEGGHAFFGPQRVTTNIPAPGIFYIERLTIGGLDLLLGEEIDAWQYNPNAVGQHLSMKNVDRSAKMVIKGRYTGLVPFLPRPSATRPPTRDQDGEMVTYMPGEKFTLMVSITGPVTWEKMT